MSSDLTLKVKQTNGKKETKEISINLDNTIGELKMMIEKEFNVLKGKQNWIFQGHVLFDTKKIEECKIKSGDTIWLVEKMSDGENNESKVPNVNIQTGVGAPGQINYDLLKQPMSGNVNYEQMEQILSNPELAEHMKDMLNDPSVINSMLENPSIKPLVDSNPMMRSMLSNPEFMRNLMNPETLRMMSGISGGIPNSTGTNNQSTNSQQGNQMNNPLMFNPFMMGMMPPGQQGGGQSNAQSQGQMPMYNPYMYNPMFNPMFMNMGGFSQANSNPMNQVMTPEQLKEKYKDQNNQLIAMGFQKEDDNIKALTKTNGNVEAAVERLLNNNI